MERLRDLALFTLSFGLLSGCSSAFAGNSRQSAAPISLRLVPLLTSITLGEPVVVKYEISTTADQRVVVDLGEDQENWLEVTVAPGTPAHHIVPVKSANPLRTSGLSIHPLQMVASQYRLNGHIVLSRRLSFVKPGRYKLSMAATLPYLIGGDAGSLESLRPGPAPYTSPTGVLRTKSTLVVIVRGQDVKRLHDVARKLVSTATARGRNVEEARAAIQALFTMPPNVVASEWLALVQNEQLGFQIVTAVEEMVRTGSSQAVDILAKLHSDVKRPAYVRTPARLALLHIWRGDHGALRERISHQFLATEGKMPNAEAALSPAD